MELREITDKIVWEDFISQFKEKTFLQSWNWGEFEKKMGEKIWRLGVFENNNLVSLSLAVKVAARRGTFLFVPHGPLMLDARSFNFLLSSLKEIALKEKADFIRIAPILEKNEENVEVFSKFKQAPIHIHPELTWQLDLNSSEDELLMNARKTTRYLIKQGLKNKDLKIYQTQNLEDIEKFYNIHQEVVNRQNFIPFSLEYLKNEFLSFEPDSQVSIFLAKYKEKIISSAIILFWQGIAFYHHGASSSENREIPASYLLQWEVIKEAKKRNCRLYNFWGIAPKENHPWKGLSLFKKGFGGCAKEYVKTQDWPLSKKYWLTFLFEKLRNIRRFGL